MPKLYRDVLLQVRQVYEGTGNAWLWAPGLTDDTYVLGLAGVIGCMVYNFKCDWRSLKQGDWLIGNVSFSMAYEVDWLWILSDERSQNSGP